MHPAFSVIFLTTLIGAGQGLFLALAATEAASALALLPAPGGGFYAAGAAVAVGLTGAGLLASFFHLGHPERAWRSAACWRTSWLSREVIVLPAFMAVVAGYGLAHYFVLGGTLALGAAGAILAIALFVCTAMIYACLKFLQEWATPWTVVNYLVLGSASGFTLAAALAVVVAPGLAATYGGWALAATLAGWGTRSASLARNARLKPRSTLQTAIGVKHPRVAQKSQGFMGGSFNTREFFHGRGRAVLRAVKWGFILAAFVLPSLLLATGLAADTHGLFVLAFAAQYPGLVAERWFFFAQANHPQNLYYQAIS